MKYKAAQVKFVEPDQTLDQFAAAQPTESRMNSDGYDPESYNGAF